ncbi:MAG: hypothetical protein K9G76_10700 [Bacteroidales bacterium]|nr:hypothetical protein [Bacteroidales bacterium]MCF8404238.1 hypothetical protein [Bacteroidales bacterium]
MKKIFLALFIACLISGLTHAQTFTKESLVANLGLGLGWYSYGYSVSSLPSISLSVEKGAWDIEDVGIISLGGIVGWKYAKYDWSYLNYSYDWTWADFIVAARGAIHPKFLSNEKADLYGGLALGLRFETYKYYSGTLNGEPLKYTDNNTNPLIALYIGGRYYFSDHFGLFGEIGYGLGYLNIGASYKI